MMGQKQRRLLLVGVIVASLLVGAGGGVVLDRQLLMVYDPPSNVPADAAPEFELLAEAWNLVDRVYVDRSVVEPKPMGYGAISGMVDSLGDTGHSRFLSPQMVADEHQYIQGQYVGIGAYVQMKDGQVVIVAPIEGSPAQKAGLKSGDIILDVDGESVAGLTLSEVISHVMGPAGTKVTLTIRDPKTGDTRTVTITRAEVTIHNVTWRQLPGTTVAHLRIAGFSQGVTDDLKSALQEIQGQQLSGLIMDLRDNPGGLLEEAVSTASQFLQGGNVLIEVNAQGERTPVPVKPDGIATTIPMVVLVNSGTASASEIVGGALQDPERAQLVGETTFGTGTVLGEFSLSDGSALLLATEEWLTPDGHTIWHQGLTPNVVVPLPSGTSPLFPGAEEGMTAQALAGSGDTQLLKALSLLGQGG
jgi:carboxyl-terminal processing protease